MPEDKEGGHQLASIQALGNIERRVKDEREQIIGFIRYVRRKSNDQAVHDVLRGIEQDIDDALHYKEAYQR